MNREIKFRGKTRSEGIWIVGEYNQRNQTITWDEGNHCDYCVDDNTVGQYTGMKDKNGKEIYEGDIVEVWRGGSQCKGEVKQRIDGLWLIYPEWQNGNLWTFCPDEHGQAIVRVIGNIYDNKELLEDKQ